MSDFTIEQSQPQYNPWTPLEAMGSIAQQNNAVQQGQIQNQGSLLNLQLQKARLQPILSALQGYQSQLPPQQPGNGSALATASAPITPVGSAPLGAAGASGAAAPGGPGGGPGMAPGGSALAAMGGSGAGGSAPMGASGGSPSTDGLPPGPGDLAASQVGFPMPVLQYASAATSQDPSGALAKIAETRRQLLYTGAASANSPEAWNSFVMSAYQNGWATAGQTQQLLNHFELQPRVLQAMASPDENLKYTGEISGQGLAVDANGNPVPGAAQIAARGDLAQADAAGKNAGNLPLAGTIAQATAAGTQAGELPYVGPRAAAAAGATLPYDVTKAQAAPYSLQPGETRINPAIPGMPDGSLPPGAPGSAPSGPNPNNPGNLKNPGGVGFQTFESPVAGLLAMSDQLQRYGQRGINTVGSIVSTYAPSSENNTAAYAASVAKSLGVDPNAPLNLNDPNIRARLATAMLQQEGNSKGLAAALGGGPAQAAPAPQAQSLAVPAQITPGSADQLPGAAPAVGPVGAAVASPAAAPAIAAPVTPAPADQNAAAPSVIPLPGGGTSVQAPAQPLIDVEQAKANIGAMTTYRQGLLTNAQASVQQNAVLDQMQQEAGGFTQGEFADVKGAAGSYLDGFAKTFGVPESQSFSQGVGDWQAFNKNAGNLARSAAHELGSRTGVQELAMIQRTLPSDETSSQGFSMVKNQLQGINDFAIAKSAASANFTGNPNQFEANWNANVSPSAFIINRMSPADFQAMAEKLKQTPEGLQTLKQMRDEYAYAQNQGLFKMVQP